MLVCKIDWFIRFNLFIKRSFLSFFSLYLIQFSFTSFSLLQNFFYKMNYVIEWINDQTWSLINKRKNKNEDYHKTGRSKVNFWNEIAREINRECETSFTGRQCSQKFSNLVKDYNVCKVTYKK